MAEEPTRRIDWSAEDEPGEDTPTHAEEAASLEPAPTYDQPVAYVSLGLTVGDGFKFGCGLMMAVVITVLVGLLVISVALLVASLMGVPVPLGAAAAL